MSETTANTASLSEEKSLAPKPSGGGFGGIAAILLAVIVGGAVGVWFGEPMWIASGGPTAKIAALEKTRQQKKEFALSAQKKMAEAKRQGDSEAEKKYQDEAAKLRGHVPKIDQEIARLQGIQKEAVQQQGQTWYRVAALVAELTRFCGDMFLQSLSLLVIPLVVTSMICGVTSLGDVRKIGWLGGWTLSYYMGTAAVAVLLGIMLVQLIQPGANTDDTYAYVPESVQAKEHTTALGTLLDVFRGREAEGHRDPGSGMVPKNLIAAAGKTNVLGLIAFALLFGAALTTIGPRGQVAIDFFHGANEAVMKLVHLVMIFAPIGIYGLVASKIVENGGASAFGLELGRLAWYAATVLIGLAIHAGFLALLLPLLARRNPFIYTYNMLRALLTAMSTASSSATLPVTMECVTVNNGVSERSSGFVLPLGATINMDGTALYEAVAAIFIAQSLGMDLSGAQLLIIFLTATLAAIGAAGIPEAGLVTMVLVLNAAGIPMSGIGTILAIDWFLDRMRTTVNVYGDSVGAAIVDHHVVALKE